MIIQGEVSTQVTNKGSKNESQVNTYQILVLITKILSECLDSVLCPRFVRLAENYLGPTLLFTNPTKRWKTQMNYFVLFTLVFSWSYSTFSPKNQLTYKLFCNGTFNNKFSIFSKISGIQTDLITFVMTFVMSI